MAKPTVDGDKAAYNCFLSEHRPFQNRQIQIWSASPGQSIDVSGYLRHPNEYHGDPHVHHVIKFGEAFQPLIGKYTGEMGEWNPNILPQQGIVVLEHHYNDARMLTRMINGLAARVIEDNTLYDDKHFCDYYYNLTREGYGMLSKHAAEFGLDARGTAVSLERGGLVATRVSLDADKDAVIPDEVRVVTKRTHLVNEPEDHLTVTVTWRDRQQLCMLVNGQLVDINDFVNPASGASVAGFIESAAVCGVKPKAMAYRSIMLTQQGTLFMKRYLEGKGIAPVFYSVGDCDEMDDHYYLKSKPVADAGHILRHFLPKSI